MGIRQTVKFYVRINSTGTVGGNSTLMRVLDNKCCSQLALHASSIATNRRGSATLSGDEFMDMILALLAGAPGMKRSHLTPFGQNERGVPPGPIKSRFERHMRLLFAQRRYNVPSCPLRTPASSFPNWANMRHAIEACHDAQRSCCSGRG